MDLYKYANRFIIDDDNNRVFLAHSKDISEVTYNTGDYATLYRLEDGIMSRVSDDVPLRENDFDELYEEYTEFDAECGREKIEAEDIYGDVNAYVKAEWSNYEHYMRLESEHGINTSSYDFTDAEIIEGKCFKADDYIAQNYPHIACQTFFKFVADDGREFYIKETMPFIADESDYVFELIEKDEFDEYDDLQ